MKTKSNPNKRKKEVLKILKDHSDKLGENPDYNERKSILIPILEEIQEKFKHISRDAAVLINEELNIPLSHIYGVITFYNSLKLESCSDYQICVCRGTACHVNGSDNLLDILKEKVKNCDNPDLFTIETVNCVGACSLAPVFIVNGDIHGKMNKKKVNKLIDGLVK